MIWLFTRTIGYATTVPFVVIAVGAGRVTWGFGASMGLLYFGACTWPTAVPGSVATTVSRREATLAPLNIRRAAALSNRFLIVSTVFKFTNLKRSLSLPLPLADNLLNTNQLTYARSLRL